MSTVSGVVIARSEDGGQSAIFSPGDSLPEWAVDALKGHKFLVAEDRPADPDKGGPGAYESLTKAQLVEAIEARNTGRDEDKRLATAGNKSDLVAALVADDAAGDN